MKFKTQTDKKKIFEKETAFLKFFSNLKTSWVCVDVEGQDGGCVRGRVRGGRDGGSLKDTSGKPKQLRFLSNIRIPALADCNIFFFTKKKNRYV